VKLPHVTKKWNPLSGGIGLSTAKSGKKNTEDWGGKKSTLKKKKKERLIPRRRGIKPKGEKMKSIKERGRDRGHLPEERSAQEKKRTL